VRLETSTNILDCIQLEFHDKYGNYVLSLEDFVVTLVFDEVLTEVLPQEDRVSLHKVRKQTAEDVRQDLAKKLRLSNNNVIY